MESIKLVFPTKNHEKLIEDFVKECKTYPTEMDGMSNVAEIPFFEWLEKVKLDYAGLSNDPSRVPATTFLVFNDNTLVGFVNIRHVLNPFLNRVGGHIGYMVRPLQRRKGFAKALLKEALKYCKYELKLRSVLVTCDHDNEASKRTIRANGGNYENTVNDETYGEVERYWINLNAL